MAQYTAIFTKPYEDGYENLPSQNTPITAETLNDKDAAIEHIEDYLSSNDIPSDAEGLSYNNTDSGLTADNVQGAVDELADEKVDKTGVDVKTDATGQFNTITGGLMQSCVVDLEPIQNLHGYSKPWTGGSGKNKLPLTVEGIKSLNQNLTWVGNTTNYNSVDITIDTDNDGNVIGITTNGVASSLCTFNIANYSLEAGTYTLNGCPSGGSTSSYYIDWRTDEGVQMTDVGYGYTYTSAGQNGKTCRMLIYPNINMSGKTFYPMIRESTQSATFEPYSNICPISGHTQVQVGNCGKNKFSGVESGGIDTTTGQNTSMSNTYRSTSYIPLENGDSYTFSGLLSSSSVIRIFYYDEDKNYISTNTVSGTNNIISSTISVANTKYIRFHASSSVMTDTTEVQLEEGSQATEYTPFNGYTHVINLDGTYYGGTLDAVSGKLTVTDAFAEITASNGEYASYLNRYLIRTNVLNLPIAKSSYDECICDEFEAKPLPQIEGGAVAVYAHDNIIAICNYKTSLADYQTFLTNNPVHVAYKVATPFTIQLDPQTLETLVGQNDVFAPLQGQSLDSLTYREVLAWNDVERAVAVKLDLSSVAPIEYTDKASQSYNQKQLFIKDNKLCQALASISSGASFTENTNFKYTTLAEIIEPLIP